MVIILIILLFCPTIIFCIKYTTNYKFDKLINSDKYKNSIYEIQKYGNKYVLHIKDTDRYVDSWLYNLDWPKELISPYCPGNKRTIMNIFNKKMLTAESIK